MESIHVKFDELMAMASEHSCLKPKTNCFNVEDSSVESNQTSLPEDLEDLFGPLYKEYYEARQPKVSTNSVAPTTLNNQDTHSSSTIIVDDNEAPPLTEEAESSSTNQDPSDMHEFNQLHPSTHTWTKARPLEQVIGDPLKPVMTRSRLNTNAKVCMYTLTVSNTEPKNIKEAMQDHSWIESMQDELHQFERLKV
ncbi:hypothetical protein Tco_1425857 [Tanacetum coccineum]